MIQLEDKEFAAICALAFDCSRFDGEDVIGSLMKRGAFRVVDNQVDTAHKVEEGNKLFEKLRREDIEREKLSIRGRTVGGAGRMP